MLGRGGSKRKLVCSDELRARENVFSCKAFFVGLNVVIDEIGVCNMCIAYSQSRESGTRRRVCVFVIKDLSNYKMCRNLLSRFTSDIRELIGGRG
jgi:hypothetical protein